MTGNILKPNQHLKELYMEQFKLKVFLRSLLLSYLLSGILLVVISFALYRFRLKESQIQMAVILVYVLSCVLAGFLAGKGIRRQRFLCGLLAGGFYFAVLLAVSFLLEKGLVPSVQQMGMVLAICVGSGILGGVLS